MTDWFLRTFQSLHRNVFFSLSKMAAMVIWPDGRVTCVINDNIEGTTQTIYRTGKDISRYMTFLNGGNFNIGCNVNTTIVYIFWSMLWTFIYGIKCKSFLKMYINHRPIHTRRRTEQNSLSYWLQQTTNSNLVECHMWKNTNYRRLNFTVYGT